MNILRNVLNCTRISLSHAIACIALAVVPALNLGAQTPGPQNITVDDLNRPSVLPSYAPRSGVSLATMGTVDAEMDQFMSVFEFGRLKSHKYFFNAGFNESLFTLLNGLNAGFGTHFGPVYFGIAYGGSGIADGLRQIPNQTVIDSKTSDNTVNVLIGTGIFGAKLGFSEFIERADRSLEISLKPSLEAGVNLPIGPVAIKPAIRGAFDIHQYRSEADLAAPAKIKKLQNFWEPSAGVTLEFDFNFWRNTSLEMDIIADAAFRLYDIPGAGSVWTFQNTTVKYDTANITDIRITGSPSFIFRHAFNRRVTLGVKTDAGFGLDILKTAQANYAKMTIAPDLSAGASFNLLPDQFAIHAGLDIPVYSYSKTITDTKHEFIPSIRISAGVTVNFTSDMALDLLAIAPIPVLDREAKPPKLAVLFTMKNVPAGQINQPPEVQPAEPQSPAPRQKEVPLNVKASFPDIKAEAVRQAEPEVFDHFPEETPERTKGFFPDNGETPGQQTGPVILDQQQNSSETAAQTREAVRKQAEAEALVRQQAEADSAVQRQEEARKQAEAREATRKRVEAEALARQQAEADSAARRQEEARKQTEAREAARQQEEARKQAEAQEEAQKRVEAQELVREQEEERRQVQAAEVAARQREEAQKRAEVRKLARKQEEERRQAQAVEAAARQQAAVEAAAQREAMKQTGKK